MCEICDDLKTRLTEIGSGFPPLLAFLQSHFSSPSTAVLSALAVCRFIVDQHKGGDSEKLFQNLVHASRGIRIEDDGEDDAIAEAIKIGLRETAKKDFH